MPTLTEDIDADRASGCDLVRVRPVIYLSSTRAVYFGPSMRLTAHKLAVAAIIVGLDDAFTLDLFDCAKPQVRRLAIVPPDTLHHLDAVGRMAFIYLDPASDGYLGFDSAALEQLEQIAPARALDILAAAHPDTAPEDIVDHLSALFGLPVRSELDRRIARTLNAINTAPQDFTSIRQAADFACYSVSRFQHIFKVAVGTTFRRYRLWKRMAAVARALERGESLTTAALSAGFSSSAHLSAAFRDMFGVKPSDLITLSAQFRVSGLSKSG